MRGPGCRLEVNLRVHFKKTRLARIFLHPFTKVVLTLALLLAVCGASVFGYYYVRFAKLIDRRLDGDVFARTSKIHAAPELLFVGQEIQVAELINKLRRAGYSEDESSTLGWYRQVLDDVEIHPGSDSYFRDEPARIRVADGKVQRVLYLKGNIEQQFYELEPELITNLFDRSRAKRRLVRFEDLPPHLVNAILAAEDKSFFQHPGIDFLRVLKVAYEDIRTRTLAQGASTLTMQLARSFFLTPARTFKRKMAEVMIALQLERRLTKQQIFEFYCNQIYLGQRGSFSLHGMGEASLAYFGKDVHQLTLPEVAFLAGIIRGPNLYSPYRYAERATERRNRILDAMVRNGAIKPEQRDTAVEAPLGVLPPYVETGDAPYFVDLVREELLARYPEKELVTRGYRVYTTLDMNLQRAADEAVREGMQLVDEQLSKRKTKQPWPQAQTALVAIDPHTGDVKALVGGRFYGASQLNRAVAQRQPGSVFKPFVYASAFSSALNGFHPVITPVTVIDDTPTTFLYEGGVYEPSNYRAKFHGQVTARKALALSLNVATVKIGEMIGFDRVAQLARQAGLKTPRATPSVALGSYEVSPLDIAGAYTIFANGGVRVNPTLVRMVKSDNGEVIERGRNWQQKVLDPRVAYLMTQLLQGVVRSGTGAGVRSRGFRVPAAGKTGTSHDGWFAGYTSNLLCIVWVGFDNNRELPLSGSRSALPIWTEFMKRAASLPQYQDMVAFPEPPGLTWREVDPVSGELATAFCPQRRPEVFLEDTQPTEACSLHTIQRVSRPGFLTNPFGIGVRPPGRQPAPVPSPQLARPPASAPPASSAPTSQTSPVLDTAEPNKKERGFFGKVFGVFKGSGKDRPDKGQASSENQ